MNKACFSANGEQVIATGMRNKLFYIYDMMEGKIIPVPTVRGETPDGANKTMAVENPFVSLMLLLGGVFHDRRFLSG